MGIENIRDIKSGASPLKRTRLYSIPKIGIKKAAALAEEKKSRNGEDPLLEQWFKSRRRNMTGICQCGCRHESQKNDALYFRHSACHIFPKAKFESIMYHPLNFVERRFFGGCHANFDERSIYRWPAMADWEDIKHKFHILVEFLTPQERATKFYKTLENIVLNN